MKRDYGGVIWTDHALERLRERGIKQEDAWAVFNRPDQSRYTKSKSAWIYYKIFGNRRIEVVAKKNEEGKWIILSVWSKSVNKKLSGKKSEGGGLLSALLRFFRGM